MRLPAFLCAAALAAASPLSGQATDAGAVGSAVRALRYSIAVGVTGAETVLSEGSGLEVHGGTGAHLDADLTRRVLVGARRETLAGAFARVGTRRVEVVLPRLETSVPRHEGYYAGTMTEATVGARAEHRFLDLLSASGGVGVTYVHGPSDVAPFSNGGALHPEAELGIGVRSSARSRWSAGLRAAAYRVGTSAHVDQAGAVRTALLEVRREF